MKLKELMNIVPKLVSKKFKTFRDRSCKTKTTYGKAVLTLVKRVKILEKSLKRKTQQVVISGSEGEEPEDQGRKIQDIDDHPLVSLVRESMKEKSTDFVTPTKSSGEAQKEDTQAFLTSGGSQKHCGEQGQWLRVFDPGLDAGKEINTGIEGGCTGRAKVNSEQIRQEAAGLEEAIRLQAQMDEEVSKQIHLDKMLAKRVHEEQELAKLEANTEVVKGLQGESISNDDFAKRMVEMINEKKKFYVEQKAKARRLLQSQREKIKCKEEETEVPVKENWNEKEAKGKKGINIDKDCTSCVQQGKLSNIVKDKVNDVH
ncbi:hypothetical protein Tco_0492819 [Tanacetum coccineum]